MKKQKSPKIKKLYNESTIDLFCIWEKLEKYNNLWQSGCGFVFKSANDNPSDKAFGKCPACKRKMKKKQKIRTVEEKNETPKMD